MSRFRKLVRILMRPEFLFPLLRIGVAASVEHEQVLASLHLATVVDIGANRGQFALLCRGLFPDVQIFSFEPLPQPGVIFQKMFENDSKVHLFPYAIGAQHTTTVIHVSRRDDSSSLLPITHQAKVFPGTEEKEIQQTEIWPLYEVLNASMLAHPALLKIDVQGYELEVLKGCGDLLHEFAYVYVECSFVELYAGQALCDDVITFLHERGFALRGVYNLYYDKKGIAVQGDFLFQSKV